MPLNALAAALSLSILPQHSSPAAELAGALNAFQKEHFSGVLYVESEGKVLFWHSVGYADREAKRPFTRDTGIEIGSIVKPIVRVAAYRLAEQGKLKLDRSIAEYLPNVPDDKKSITVDHLIRHTSGFKDVFGGDYEPMLRDELIGKMLASGLLFEPGEKSEYSNSGYSMLATIIERVTGEPIEKHVARTQFKPLGDLRIGYVLPNWRPDETTVGYGRMGNRWGTPVEKFWYPDGPSWNLRGNGGMIARAPDLARWCRAAHGGELMSQESYGRFVPAWVGKAPGPESIWAAAGGNGFFNTVLAYLPFKKLIVVAASTDARFEIEGRLRALAPKILALKP